MSTQEPTPIQIRYQAVDEAVDLLARVLELTYNKPDFDTALREVMTLAEWLLEPARLILPDAEGEE